MGKGEGLRLGKKRLRVGIRVKMGKEKGLRVGICGKG